MRELPTIPSIQAFKPIPHVTASQAERLLACPLRFVLDHDPELRRLQAYSAASVVGTAAHSAVATLIRSHSSGVVSGGEESTRSVARKAFDQALVIECGRRDGVIAERGKLSGDSTEEPTALPFYGMTRARLARFAEERFGDQWLWAEPGFRGRASSQQTEGSSRMPRVVEAELLLRSRDGLVRGIADSIDSRDGKVIIEELKSGAATPERLERWRHQLLIYAHLYREQYDRAPDLLRVHSLPDGTREFSYSEADAANAVAAARAALQEVNRRIGTNTAAASDLARPTETACPQCPHRPWCEPYWMAAAPGANGTDVEGTVTSRDGWEAAVALVGGRTVRVDFKASRATPNAGSRLRICGARPEKDALLRCSQTTSVWWVRA